MAPTRPTFTLLAALAASAPLAGCGAPPDLTGCWERCGDDACGTTEGVFLEIEATTLRETAADGSTCTYTYEAAGEGYDLDPTGCTLAQTGLPERVTWTEIERDDDDDQITYTQTRIFSEEAGLEDQVNHYRFHAVACSEVPAAARALY